MKINFVYSNRKALNEGLIMSHDPVEHSSFLYKKYGSILNIYKADTNPFIAGKDFSETGPTGNFVYINVIDFDDVDDIARDMDHLYGWKLLFLRAVVTFEDTEDPVEVFFKMNPRSTGKYDRYVATNVLEGESLVCVLGDCEEIVELSICFDAKFGDPAEITADLYRAVPLKNAARIDARGMSPIGVEGKERLYFATDIDEIHSMLDNTEKFRNGYALYRLMVSEYGDEIRRKYKFYKDPRSMTGVYTKDCIDIKYLERLV